ncbi:MAG TPA: hypothetical protein DF383_08555, partial [Deltaproteobacteria bacterium]|nr:hypothetical protein [Deltaproteobacteria bacterium]
MMMNPTGKKSGPSKKRGWITEIEERVLPKPPPEPPPPPPPPPPTRLEILTKRAEDLGAKHIPEGGFEMGASDFADAQPVRQYVSDFFMDPYLVTNARFTEYMRACYKKFPYALFLTMEDGQSFIIARGRLVELSGAACQKTAALINNIATGYLE